MNKNDNSLNIFIVYISLRILQVPIHQLFSYEFNQGLFIRLSTGSLIASVVKL